MKIMDNQQLKIKNAQKFFLRPDMVYGNYRTIKEVKIQTKKCMETRWECIYIPTGEIKLQKGSYLSKFQTGEEQEQYLQELVEEDKHQQGFRNYLYRTSQHNAENRSHEFNLSYKEFIDLITQSCYYCGDSPKPASIELLKKRGNPKQPTFYYNGIDRIDSKGKYEIENCVPCCSVCNYMKRILKQSDFYIQICKIYKHLDLSSTTIPEGSTSQAYGDGNGELLPGDAEDEDIVSTL